MKPSIGIRVSRTELGNFVDIKGDIILHGIRFMFSLYFLLLDVNLQKCIDPKQETREFRSTLLF